MSQGRKRWMSQLRKWGWIDLPSLWVLFWPSGNWKTRAHIGEGAFFTSFTRTNASLCQKHPQGYTQKQCLATHLASLSPGKLTSKSNCHAWTAIPPALFCYLKTVLTIQSPFFFNFSKLLILVLWKMPLVFSWIILFVFICSFLKLFFTEYY